METGTALTYFPQGLFAGVFCKQLCAPFCNRSGWKRVCLADFSSKMSGPQPADALLNLLDRILINEARPQSLQEKNQTNKKATHQPNCF